MQDEQVTFEDEKREGIEREIAEMHREQDRLAILNMSR
jgi:hypothetical protein